MPLYGDLQEQPRTLDAMMREKRLLMKAQGLEFKDWLVGGLGSGRLPGDGLGHSGLAGCALGTGGLAGG